MGIKKLAKFSAYLSAPLSVLTAFTLASLFFIFILKMPDPVPIFIIFAFVEVISMSLYGIVPYKWKNRVRMLSMFIFGMFLVVLAGILGRNNFQIEGFWFYLFSGSLVGVIVHFIMAKIIGPLLFSRNWCSWGCWSSFIFDLLPYKTNIKWQAGNLDKFRLVHFFLSLGIVAGLVFGLNYTIIQTDPAMIKEGMGTTKEWIWLLAGNLFYYIIGIILAVKFKDNRAFCKYICPITVFLKLTNRFSFLRIKGEPAGCTNCKTCSKVCPMGINVSAYVKAKTRVLSTECIMCMKCIANCPEAILKTSIGVDFVNKELLVK